MKPALSASMVTRNPYMVRGWRTWRWLLLLAVVVAAGLVVWLLPREGLDRPRNFGVAGAQHRDAVGTMGMAGSDAPARSPGVAEPAIIRELESITGINDGHELIGRHVELHVPVQQVASHVAFWVGAPENRMLVVLARDTRDGVARQRGEGSAHGIEPFREADRVRIVGTVQQIPHAEGMWSWRLTWPEHAEVVDRRIYIRAEDVQPNGS